MSRYLLRRSLRRAATVLAAAVCAAAMPVHGGARFVWGADLGSTIDVSGNDMSTFNLDASLGLSAPYIDMVGVGAGIHMMLSNSARAIPVYGLLRTSFRRTPGLMFLELRGGPVFDAMPVGPTRIRLWLNPSVGIYLARGRRFATWLTVGYTYNNIRWYGTPPDAITTLEGHGLSGVNVRIGITL